MNFDNSSRTRGQGRFCAPLKIQTLLLTWPMVVFHFKTLTIIHAVDLAQLAGALEPYK